MQPMMINKPQDVYFKQSVLTASPIELIIMLYDGLRKNIVLGKRAIDQGKTENAHNYLMKAQDILSELVASLDIAQPISEELLRLYEFLIHTIEEANLHKDSSQLDDVAEMVASLRDTWKQVGESQRGNVSLAEE